MKLNQRLIPPLKNNITRKGLFNWLMVGVLLVAGDVVSAQPIARSGELMEVGVARIDITPTGPIRLAGYGIRKKTESEGILQPLGAKAMAFGTDAQGPSIFITVDLLGIPANITRKLTDQLSAKIGIDAARLVICASHTHGGPELGNTLNILQYRGKTFSDSMLAVDHLIRIAEYTEQLSQKLEQVALEAMKNRSPSSVSWGQGQAGFAKNRRPQGGPVDPSLPLLRVTDENGTLKAVLVNYACHGTTLGGDVNKVHGDWMGEAQRLIEGNHPGAIAMVAIGCGADANPDPRGTMEHVRLYGQEISNHVEKLLASPLQPLSSPPQGRIKWVKLPFAHVPDVSELIKQTEDKSVKGYYARLSLDRLARGQSIPAELSYPVQTWAFGDDLLMINLAGEVVADYSVRLKNELGADKLWINGYANDAPCYIASRRVIREGGYEAESSMYYYDKPGPFAEEVEDIIVEAVHTILPVSYTLKRDTVNHPQVVRSENNGELNLRAEVANAIGPEIKYMPEWKAFGWFTEADRVEWDIEVRGNGKYDVYLDWSVSDPESGKHFILEVGGKKLSGRIGKTGSWFTYKTEKIGTIRLSAGSHKVVFRPAVKTEKGALLDMRTISLIPVK
ncbi:MAG: neutral/alkaline non-lysosomal ceramidase N-terminal domain-containing protein [Cyclobacteriaceae bacterium]